MVEVKEVPKKCEKCGGYIYPPFTFDARVKNVERMRKAKTTRN